MYGAMMIHDIAQDDITAPGFGRHRATLQTTSKFQTRCKHVAFVERSIIVYAAQRHHVQ
jgi:hypothetical protein